MQKIKSDFAILIIFIMVKPASVYIELKSSLFEESVSLVSLASYVWNTGVFCICNLFVQLVSSW